MGAYWASFARNGVPSLEGGPAWPAFGEDGGSFLRLDTEDDGGIEVVRGVDSLGALVEDMMVDPRIDDAERCAIVDEMGRWLLTRSIRDRIATATGCDGARSARPHAPG